MSYLNAIIFLYSLIMENVMHSTTEGCENNKVHCGTGHVARDILSNRLKLGYTSNNLLFLSSMTFMMKEKHLLNVMNIRIRIVNFYSFFQSCCYCGYCNMLLLSFFLFTLHTRMYCLTLPLTCIFDRSFW